MPYYIMKDGLYWTRHTKKFDSIEKAAIYTDKEAETIVSLLPFIEPARLVKLSPFQERKHAKNQIMYDYDEYDKWAWAMSWMFALCDEIHFRRDLDVPPEFEFSPSPFGPSTDDPQQLDILRGLSDDQIEFLGWLVYRYTRWLERAGESY